jgi:hypothetical protein
VKPFTEREIHSSIQVVLERSKLEAKLINREERLRLALSAAELNFWQLDQETEHLLYKDDAGWSSANKRGGCPSPSAISWIRSAMKTAKRYPTPSRRYRRQAKSASSSSGAWTSKAK